MTAGAQPSPFRLTHTLPQAWREPLAVLGAAALALLILFFRDAGELARIWWTSTTFGHCLFVGPVIAWLVWQRRADLSHLTPAGWWPGLAIVGAGAFAWLVGEAASVSLARQLGLVVMLQGLVVVTLGPAVSRGLLFPLVYAFFLVPFGEDLEGPLQNVTVAMVMPLLHLVGVPAQVDGVLITIPNGYFEVAEACSGAKFVIAMLAYGVLVANVCYVSWQRRVAFMAMALIVPILANGLRAFGTIYAAHLTSVEAATGYDHIVYGWVFFGLVMAAVLAIGWKWFDRDPDAPWFDATAVASTRFKPADGRATALAGLAIASAFLAWGSRIDARADTLSPVRDLPAVRGWHRIDLSTRAPWSPNYPGADRFWIGRYVDAQGDAVDVAVAVYAGQHEGKEMIAFGQGAIRENDSWVRIADMPSLAGGAAMRMTAPGPVERQVVTFYWVGGTITSDERVAKLLTLKAKLFGGPQRSAALLLSAEAGQGDPRTALTRFLSAAPPQHLFDQVAR